MKRDEEERRSTRNSKASESEQIEGREEEREEIVGEVRLVKNVFKPKVKLGEGGGEVMKESKRLRSQVAELEGVRCCKSDFRKASS